jgi:hypothetical protein
MWTEIQYQLHISLASTIQSLISLDECQLGLQLNMAVSSGNDRIFDVLSRDGNIVVIGTIRMVLYLIWKL